jgi:3-oxoacyl-[acyl-carrier-protein] synthase-3
MLFQKVSIESPSVILPSEVLATEDIEARLQPIYHCLGISVPQIEALTGVRERRLFEENHSMGSRAAQAALVALEKADLPGSAVDMVLFCGVCRDNLEPAAACEVADVIGCSPTAQILDISNACLGMLNGILMAAAAIEAGTITTALVTSAESSRSIIQSTLDRLLAEPTPELYRKSLATMTGGSGASAILVRRMTQASSESHRLLGGAIRTAPRHHKLCRWGPTEGLLGETTNIMHTDAAAVLQAGVALGKDTFSDLIQEVGWKTLPPPKTICHQVGSIHRQAVLAAMGVPLANDYGTFEYLGNMGTVSLPITAALAEQRGHLQKNDRVAFCGIGSGLNCLSLGILW